MLLPASLAVLSLTALVDERPAIVAAPIAGNDTHTAALSSAVDGALFTAATARGLRPTRADAVLGVKEALAACTDDGCRATTARRLGARFTVHGQTRDNELLLFLLDEHGARVSGIAIGGAAPVLLAQVPRTVDALIEAAVPQAQHARALAAERADRAEQSGDIDVADALYREALAAGPLDDEAAELFLLRARMLDRHQKAGMSAACWDELLATFGDGTPGAERLSAEQRARIAGALDDHLMGLAARLLH